MSRFFFDLAHSRDRRKRVRAWNSYVGSWPQMAKEASNDNGSYFEFDVMRAAFQRWLDEDKAPEDQWRPRATKLVRIMTGDDYVDPNMVEWIIRKKPQR